MFGGGEYGITNQFGGGGFMPSQQNETGYGRGGGQQKGRSTNQETLRAVTIRQLAESMSQQDSDVFRVDGMDLSNVTLVGKVVEVNEANLKYRLTVSDGTGTADVIYWMPSDENEWEQSAKKSQWQRGNYVRVYGKMQVHDQKPSVSAYTIRPIIDFNEVTHHNLQCIFQHAHLLKRQQGGAGGAGMGAGGAAPSSYAAGGGWNAATGGGFGGGAAAAAGFGGGGGAAGGAGGSCQDAVMAIMSETSSMGDGLHINDVVARLQGRFNRQQVKEAMDALANEALVYTTTDDEHFRAS